MDINSLAPGKCGFNSNSVIFKLILWIDTLSTSNEIAPRVMPQNPLDDKSTLVSVLCRHIASPCHNELKENDMEI